MTTRNNALDGPGRTPVWDISQDRAFIETLLGQRFNFLLIFFSVFIAGGVNARDTPLLQAIVLTIGAVIALLLMLAVNRAQEKLDIALNIIFEEDPDHPATVLNQRARKGGSRRKIVGYAIPWICFLTLLIWSFFAWNAAIKPKLHIVGPIVS
jgi:Flp pilus assembly protein protease CpaA